MDTKKKTIIVIKPIQTQTNGQNKYLAQNKTKIQFNKAALALWL